ncbi:MAG TPA: guanylate kinase [Dehalococcoidia bacterium]|nr:guanylate kinase [Dehalococcoidia bacterium]
MTNAAAGGMSAARDAPAPLFVVLSGPSGAGKDSLLDELERRGHRFHRVITCTTRPPRAGERDGVDYYFVSDAAFDELIASGGLLEHAQIYGHRSGVPRAQVEEQLAAGVDVFVRTDVQGAASIRKLAPRAVLVFVAPASLEELEARIRARATEDEERIARRLAAARDEMARQAEFDYVVVNAPGRLDRAADRLEEILDAERARPRAGGPLL